MLKNSIARSNQRSATVDALGHVVQKNEGRY